MLQGTARSFAADTYWRKKKTGEEKTKWEIIWDFCLVFARRWKYPSVHWLHLASVKLTFFKTSVDIEILFQDLSQLLRSLLDNMKFSRHSFNRNHFRSRRSFDLMETKHLWFRDHWQSGKYVPRMPNERRGVSCQKYPILEFGKRKKRSGKKSQVSMEEIYNKLKTNLRLQKSSVFVGFHFKHLGMCLQEGGQVCSILWVESDGRLRRLWWVCLSMHVLQHQYQTPAVVVATPDLCCPAVFNIPKVWVFWDHVGVRDPTCKYHGPAESRSLLWCAILSPQALKIGPEKGSSRTEKVWCGFFFTFTHAFVVEELFQQMTLPCMVSQKSPVAFSNGDRHLKSCLWCCLEFPVERQQTQAFHCSRREQRDQSVFHWT